MNPQSANQDLFFIQGDVDVVAELTGYEYFTQEEISGERAKSIAPYLADMDFAYFAVKLGWSLDDYDASTPVQRAFIRKEIERQTVEASELVAEAAEVAIVNAHRKTRRRFKLWRKRQGAESPPISKKEMGALREQMKRNTPWSPWREVGNGRLHAKRKRHL